MKVPNRAIKGRIWALDQKRALAQRAGGKCRGQEQLKAFPLQGFTSFTKDKDGQVQGTSCYGKRKTLLADFTFPADMLKRSRVEPAPTRPPLKGAPRHGTQVFTAQGAPRGRAVACPGLQGHQWGGAGKCARAFSHLQRWLLPWRLGSRFHGLPCERL